MHFFNPVHVLKIAEVTQCGDITDGVLFVNVSTAAWRQELSYLKKEILIKIRDLTGYKKLTDIKFH